MSARPKETFQQSLESQPDHELVVFSSVGHDLGSVEDILRQIELQRAQGLT